MRRIILLFIVSFILLQDVYAQMQLKQRGKGEHRLSLTYTPQQYFNSINISSEGQPQVIHTQNTFGYKLGLDYQRTTRYGLIFGGGISYGSQRNTIGVVYENLSFFDPQADNPDRLAATSNSANYSFTSKYAALQLKVGHSLKLPARWGKGWRLETIVGITSRLYLNKPEEVGYTTYWRIMYEKGGISYPSTVGSDYGSWPNKGQLTLAETFEGYIGMSKAIHCGWISNFSFGIEVGRNLFRKGSSAYQESNVTNFYKERVAYSTYKAKDFSLGIKLAVGLWPNIKEHR